MKNIFFKMAMVVIVATAMTINSQAQQGLNVSVKATPLFSFLQNSDDSDNNAYEQDATFSTNFGLGVGYNFTDNLGVGLDVLYGLQGQKYTLNNTEINQRVDYLKIPLYFSYNTDISESIGFYGKIGPQLNILTNAEYSTGGNDNFVDNKDSYEDITFGAMVNLGVQFRLSEELLLQTGLYFDYDFTNAENEDFVAYPKGRAETYNMNAGIQLSLQYNF